MAVKIRLRRLGAKKQPYYRVVVADSRYPRDGRFIEEIGIYNPMTDPSEIKIDLVKVADWIKKGAQPTDSVKSLIRRAQDPNYGKSAKGKGKIKETAAEPAEEVAAEIVAEPAEVAAEPTEESAAEGE